MSKTIKIQVLASCAGKDFVYGKGFIGDVSESIAKDLIKGGLAVEVSAPKKGVAMAPTFETRKK